MLNHLMLGKSLIKPRLDEPLQKVRGKPFGDGRKLSWLHHQVSEILRPLPRR